MPIDEGNDDQTKSAVDVEKSVGRKRKKDIEDAINFVNKIKQRFIDHEDVYKNFLNILNNYRRGNLKNKNPNEVFWQVATLFYGHDDLVKEFEDFLPEQTIRRKLND
ncbi:hypothetical protein niasHT_027053 [Heterodera trifolii]|uniref:Uncharacterized protein n=1 Tax=Heterodera trifolii TaxID=157864 RepID=A0ABD2JG91_9BILA